MPTDVFTLGNLIVDEFSTPQDPQFGGVRDLIVHNLPGGSRVVDLLGAFDGPGGPHKGFTFYGTFWGDNAASNAEALDAMRISGATQTLSWGGRAWQVIVSNVEITCHRFPMHYSYHVDLVVVQNNMFPASGAIATIDAMLVQDMATAMAIVGL
jgi:hypothetical protein